MSQQIFQNTFAPLIENQELTVNNIIKGLFLGFIRYEDLPKEVRKAVDEEMKKIKTSQSDVDTALKAYLTGKQLSDEDFEKMNFTEATQTEQDGHWVTIKGSHVFIKQGQSLEAALKAKGIDVSQKPLMPEEKPQKKSILDKFKKQEPEEQPAFTGAEFEPIIKSNAPTIEHMTTAEQIMSFYPNVFGQQREFLVHQAWAADQLRAAHTPVAKELEDGIKQAFPGIQTFHRIKKRYNMLEKLGRKPERYHTVQDLTDISGVKAIPQTIREAHAVVEHLKNTHDIIETEDYIDQPNNGYRAMQLLVKDRKTGLVTEIQIKTPRQDKWSFWDHDFEYKPRNQKIKNIIDQHKEEIHDYALKMSAYYFSLDNNETNLQVPDCPEIVRRILECME